MPNDESIHNHSAGALARIEETGLFTIDDLDLISSVFSSFNTRNGTPWDALRKAHMILPSWFRAGLDPSSDEYLQQQKMLWKIVVGVDRDYDPHEDEQTDDPRGDPIRFPGYFRGRGAQAIQTAANHIIATGMIMLHSGLKPGSWALEYGAGFGQTSVALARMGVNVDTVDISAAFCGYIKEQAAFFGIHNLNPFKGEFGLNPRGAHKYDLIFFYESFHHCLDFKNVIRAIKTYLSPKGRVLLAGEPVVPKENSAIPYPWGLRLHSECIAVMRSRRWCELGFCEDFIADVFMNNGFAVVKKDCHVSHYGTTWICSLRENRISLNNHWMSNRDALTWHGSEKNGRWSTARSSLTLDSTESFSALEICAANHHPIQQELTVIYGEKKVVVSVDPHKEITFRIDADAKCPNVIFECQTFVPADFGKGSSDRRALGIFINHIDYC